MAIARDQLQSLETAGWSITRDGSTATARFNWDDPEDPDVSWELLVLHTAGHPNRFSLDAEGLSERSVAEANIFAERFDQARLLLSDWLGELPDESDS